MIFVICVNTYLSAADLQKAKTAEFKEMLKLVSVCLAAHVHYLLHEGTISTLRHWPNFDNK